MVGDGDGHCDGYGDDLLFLSVAYRPHVWFLYNMSIILQFSKFGGCSVQYMIVSNNSCSVVTVTVVVTVI